MKKSTKYIIFIIFSSILLSQEKIIFNSASPFSFKDIITNLENLDKTEVSGLLKLPKGEGPFPLIIGVAGSLDWGEHHLEYLDMYRSMGIATFELQSFSSRGIKSTVGSQVNVTTAMMVLDAYKALETLTEHPMINKEKVAITGWSLGGGVALFSGWEPLFRKINPKIKFAAHLSIYPPCIAQPENLKFTDAPMHILIGELDNWVPAKACEELVPEMQKVGVNINLTVYPESHHSFDRDTPLVTREDAYRTVDCRFKLRDDGTVIMNFLNIPMTTPFRQKIGLALCAKRGTTMGGNPKTRKEAFQFAREFMGKHLLDN
ncbi:MAG: dienelactone hydrolase family protein [Candidatus Marinimicrobia bacterium]|nr:dienelactone hydrolase family protein [Candidatus Neomarinimicrobiota bacterium]|tara:strand:+ start:448 stop:1401 length:954 start_codon:yes stop_codon:yes gene_type:complete